MLGVRATVAAVGAPAGEAVADSLPAEEGGERLSAERAAERLPAEVAGRLRAEDTLEPSERAEFVRRWGRAWPA